MARQYNIRWSDKDERELKRVVKNFNSKVKRIEEKEPFFSDARPDKITYKDIKGKINTRQDLKRYINRYKRFSKRGAEDIRTTDEGIVTTNWQFKEASIMQRQVTRSRRERRSKIDSWQVQQAETLIDKPRVGSVKPSGFKKYLESLEKETQSTFNKAKKERYLANYIDTVKHNLGVHGTEIINYVKALDLDVFIDNSLTNPYLNIDFIYGEEEKRALASYILNEWQRVT